MARAMPPPNYRSPLRAPVGALALRVSRLRSRRLLAQALRPPAANGDLCSLCVMGVRVPFQRSESGTFESYRVALE
jgi:hypothetical protein